MAFIGSLGSIPIDPDLLLGSGYMDFRNSYNVPRWLEYALANCCRSVYTANLTSGSIQGSNVTQGEISEFNTPNPGLAATLYQYPVLGRTWVIANMGPNSLNVYPALGQNINSLAVNASISIASGTTMRFVLLTPTHWRTW